MQRAEPATTRLWCSHHKVSMLRPNIRDWLGRLQQQKKLIVYKIHGSFAEPGKANEEPPPLIITEDDYIEFLTILGRGKGEEGESGKIGVPQRIITELATSSLLFLGYSLEDWDFRDHPQIPDRLAALAQFAQIDRHPKSLCEPTGEITGFRKTCEIFDIDLYDFVDQLNEAFP